MLLGGFCPDAGYDKSTISASRWRDKRCRSESARPARPMARCGRGTRIRTLDAAAGRPCDRSGRFRVAVTSKGPGKATTTLRNPATLSDCSA